GQETSFGLSQAIYEGTPISSCISTISGTTGSSCQVAEGRGNFAIIQRAANGDFVKSGVEKGARTPTYLQTDLSVRHEIRVSSEHKNYRLVIEGNSYNILNQHSATSIYQYLIAGTNVISPTRASRFPGDPRVDWAKLLNGYNYIDALNGAGAFAGLQSP